MITKNQAEVIRWWHSGCDYHQGVMFFARFSRNKTLIHTFMRKQPRYGQQKLNYELPKAVQLDWRNMPAQEEAEKVFQELENTASESNNSEQTIIDAEFSASQVIPESEKDKIIPLKVSKNIPLVSDKPVGEYPKIIRRIKYHYSSLYRTRSILHREMGDVAPENSPENMKKRASLFTRIKELSLQMDYYYQFIREYENTGFVPEESAVEFLGEKSNATTEYEPVDEKEQVVATESNVDAAQENHVDEKLVLPEETILPENVKHESPVIDTAGLKRRKKNLQTANTKDKNLLLYQDKSRQEKENPMPEGPKRQKIVLRIKGREEEVAKIEVQLANAEVSC